MAAESSRMTTIAVVTRADFDDLLPLVRGYCDFYSVSPADADLLAMSQALVADPEHEGVQLLARAERSEPLGFATVFWTWSTARAARIGVMNDLFVIPQARAADRRAADRSLPGAVPDPRGGLARLADGAREPHGATSLRPRRGSARAVARLLASGGRRPRWPVAAGTGQLFDRDPRSFGIAHRPSVDRPVHRRDRPCNHRPASYGEKCELPRRRSHRSHIATKEGSEWTATDGHRRDGAARIVIGLRSGCICCDGLWQSLSVRSRPARCRRFPLRRRAPAQRPE